MTDQDAVAFEALIKKLEYYSYEGGDKKGTILLQFQPDTLDPKILDRLNRLHRADAFVKVGIAK